MSSPVGDAAGNCKYVQMPNQACLISDYQTEWLMEAEWHLCLFFLAHWRHNTLAWHCRGDKRWEFEV